MPVIAFASIYGMKSQTGLVEVSFDGEKVAQMDVNKARELRDNLAGAIEAAISDELIVKFLTTKIGLPMEAAARALLDFRELRQGTRETVIPS